MNNAAYIVVGFISVVITLLSTYTLGSWKGALARQQTILEECRTHNVYTDRRLLLECKVHEPGK
jgi:hypothetical protein